MCVCVRERDRDRDRERPRLFDYSLASEQLIHFILQSRQLPPLVIYSFTNQGPVVQSVVSLTSSLRVSSLTVLTDSIHNILIFFAEKCE